MSELPLLFVERATRAAQPPSWALAAPPLLTLPPSLTLPLPPLSLPLFVRRKILQRGKVERGTKKEELGKGGGKGRGGRPGQGGGGPPQGAKLLFNLGPQDARPTAMTALMQRGRFFFIQGSRLPPTAVEGAFWGPPIEGGILLLSTLSGELFISSLSFYFSPCSLFFTFFPL